jgi:hypothetical protein
MNPPRWPMVLFSLFLGLVGLPLLLGGGAAVAAQLALRDADGDYSSSAYRLSTASDAVVLDDIDLDFDATPLRPERLEATARIAAQGNDDRPVFVGVASRAEIDTYLTGVAHERVTDAHRTHLDTSPVPGSTRANMPTDQRFWVASAAGSGRQEITWPVQEGRWAVVVMNADATPGVDVTASAAVHAPHLAEVAMVALIAGVLTLLGCISAALWVTPRIPAMSPGWLHQDRAFPLHMTADRDTAPSRWLWAVKWVLAVPHLLILTGLWVAFIVLTLIAGVMILITGHYPRRVFDFNVAVMRWTWRVGHYSYLTLGTDHYPPFTLTAPAFPASLDIAYPGRLSRGLVLVKWLLVIPHLMVLAFLTGSTSAFGLFGVGSSSLPFSTGLIGLLVVVAAGHLVLLRRYPQGLFDLLLGLNRWVFRTVAYLALMTDVYPPFRLDPGEETPRASTSTVDPATAVMAAELIGSPN